MATIEGQTKCTLESNIWLNPRIIVGLFYYLSVVVKYNAAVDQPAAICCSLSIVDHLKMTDGGGMVLILLLFAKAPDLAQ